MAGPQRTEAAVLVELCKPLALMELEIPPLKPGQVLVDIAFSGVCGSQVNEARGRRGVDRFLPHVMGHEGSGIVAAVGEGVGKAKPGDRVVLSWIKGSGADVPSTGYQAPIGKVNSGAVCTFMRRTVTCENRLTVIPDHMPLREAVLLGCAIPTGGGIVLNTGAIKRGQSVAVFGVGGVGLSAVVVAAMLGASPIIAIDVSEEKLVRARKLGATHTLNFRTQDAVNAVRDIIGAGVDLSVEAAGRPEVMAAAFRVVRDGGGLCVLAGNVAAGEGLTIDPFDLLHGKRLLGSSGGDTNPDRDIPRYVDFFTAGKLPLKELATHEFSLAQVNEALTALETGKVGRAVFNMSLR